MCDSGREASPKHGVVGNGGYIVSEHGIHAQNAESAGSYITGAFARENPCSSYIGGGDVPSAKSDGGFLSSPKEPLVLYHESDLCSRTRDCPDSLDSTVLA